MVWRHVVIGTRRSWLHGDPRGFRSRRHRIHSGGDYKQPPPAGEHIGLHQYHQSHADEAVEFFLKVRVKICREFVSKMKSMGLRIIACAVGKRHLHALVEMPDNYAASIKAVGRCKQKASHAVRKELPGIIWSAGESLKLIRTRGHLHSTYKYIRTRQESGAIVWSHNDDENWIDNEALDVLMMIAKRSPGRLIRMQAGV